MGRIVAAVYRPKPSKERELVEVLRDHLPVLRGEGLATDREPVAMRAADGTIVEVFEWASSEAIEAAHANAEVAKLWERFAEVCEFGTLSDLPEVSEMFAEFEPVAL